MHVACGQISHVDFFISVNYIAVFCPILQHSILYQSVSVPSSFLAIGRYAR
jgi:hypothetical protein